MTGEREAWAFEFVILGCGAVCWAVLLSYFVWNRYVDERRMHWATPGGFVTEEGRDGNGDGDGDEVGASAGAAGAGRKSTKAA